jgi:hypothetical protein
MKLADITIGGRYTAKVSGRIQTVRVLRFREVAVRGGLRTYIEALNEATGRQITIRSPQRLRSKVVPRP